MSDLSKVYDRSRVPLYIQVASVMRRRIETNQWQPGQKISTLVELEREFEVARVTVRQAIDVLRQEGLLHSEQGRGTFVAEKSIPRHWFKLATRWEVLVGAIKDNLPKSIEVENPPPAPVLQAGEGTAARRYVYMRSVQYKENEPYGLVNVHLADEVFRRAPEEFRQHPALSVLANLKGIEVDEAHQTIVIGSADRRARRRDLRRRHHLSQRRHQDAHRPACRHPGVAAGGRPPAPGQAVVPRARRRADNPRPSWLQLRSY